MASIGKARRRIGFTRARGWVTALLALGMLALPAAAHAEPPGITPAPLGGVAATVGVALDGTPGVTGTQPVAVSYQWETCNDLLGCLPLPGATGDHYTPTGFDVGQRLRVAVSASNGEAPDVVGLESDQTAAVQAPPPPSQVTNVSISGNAVAGQQLTVSASVTGTPSYAWQRCDSGGGSCTATPEASATYTLTDADVNARLKAIVTATNGADSASGEALSPVVAAGPAAPQITSGPTIAGNAALGQVLTASATASGNPSPGLTYTWLRCDAAGNSCDQVLDVDGPGEAPRYTVGALDVGRSLRVSVVASNSVGSTPSQASAPVGPVAGPPAQIDGAVTVSPSTLLTVGVTLRASVTATGNLTYQWRRCSGANSGSCANIAGANGDTYTLTADDVDFRMRVFVSADNADGHDDAISPPTSVVAAPPAQPGPTTPPSVSTPTISGIAVVGQVLTAGATVTGNPQPALAFQWQRCDAGGNACQDIAGAAGVQRTVVDADRGATLRVIATASNGTAPDATQRSAATDVVQAAGPNGTVPNGTGFDTTTSGASPGPTSRAALSPFPQVRIRGRLLKGGARITLFSITAPVGARISIHCDGRGCPKVFVSNARRSVTRVALYERFLRAGVRIKVRISRTGFIGKYSSFVIRNRQAPVRRDMCLPSPTSKPVRCAT
jgi:hypothetical protein